RQIHRARTVAVTGDALSGSLAFLLQSLLAKLLQLHCLLTKLLALGLLHFHQPHPPAWFSCHFAQGHREFPMIDDRDITIDGFISLDDAPLLDVRVWRP